MASIIKTLTKPQFKKQFNLGDIYQGYFFADFETDQLRTGVKGLDNDNKEVSLIHDKVLILSQHKDQMNVFGFDDLKELNCKELKKSTICLDYEKNVMTNEVVYLNQNLELEKVILETKI